VNVTTISLLTTEWPDNWIGMQGSVLEGAVQWLDRDANRVNPYSIVRWPHYSHPSSSLAKQPFLSHSLRRFCQIVSGFHSLGLTTVIFIQSKFISPASNPQPEGPGLCIYVPQ
jgi:hypothetical protein